MAEDKKFIPNIPSTCIPIPMVTMRCKDKCCAIETFPLLMAIGLTSHKAQGMMIAEGKPSRKPCFIFPPAPPETCLLTWDTSRRLWMSPVMVKEADQPAVLAMTH